MSPFIRFLVSAGEHSSRFSFVATRCRLSTIGGGAGGEFSFLTFPVCNNISEIITAHDSEMGCGQITSV